MWYIVTMSYYVNINNKMLINATRMSPEERMARERSQMQHITHCMSLAYETPRKGEPTETERLVAGKGDVCELQVHIRNLAWIINVFLKQLLW